MFPVLVSRLNALPFSGYSSKKLSIPNNSTLTDIVSEYGKLRIIDGIELGHIVCIGGKRVRDDLFCFFQEIRQETNQFNSVEEKPIADIWKTLVSEEHFKILSCETKTHLCSKFSKKSFIDNITNKHMLIYPGYEFLNTIQRESSKNISPVTRLEVTEQFIDSHKMLMLKAVPCILDTFTVFILQQIFDISEYSGYVLSDELRKLPYSWKSIRHSLGTLKKNKLIKESENIVDKIRAEPYMKNRIYDTPIVSYTISTTFYAVVHQWLSYKPTIKPSGFMCTSCSKKDTWTEDLTCSECGGQYDTIERKQEEFDDRWFKELVEKELDSVHVALIDMMRTYLNKKRYLQIKKRIRYPQWEQKKVKRTCVEYVSNDESFTIPFQPTFKPRDFQVMILSKLFSSGGVQNSILNLPCGSGKTAVGLSCIATIQRKTLILVNTNESRNQWLDELHRFTHLPYEYIYVAGTPQPANDPKIVIATYTHMYRYLTNNWGTDEQGQKNQMDLKNTDFFLILYDEVQCMTADQNRMIPTVIPHKVNIGLTGTLTEPELLSSILEDATIFDLSMTELVKQNYICPIYCSLVIVPLSRQISIPSNGNERNDVCNNNLSKIDAIMSIIYSVLESKHDSKILIYFQNIGLLKLFAVHCNRLLYIHGETSSEERNTVFNQFLTNDDINILCVSSIGDTSINLPNCDVVINASQKKGSFIQTGQRVGRANRINGHRKKYGLYFHLVTDYETDIAFGRADMKYLKEDIGYPTTEFRYYGPISNKTKYFQKEETRNLIKVYQ